ncbi:iron ABC transporter permease [Pigmentiphaga soli]|uniref:Iron ABC transporter permease n=1 Tax=Pigmentiphaga soli TaxID=1007095 RepID=A0ABP8HJT0_9BURK
MTSTDTALPPQAAAARRWLAPLGAAAVAAFVVACLGFDGRAWHWPALDDPVIAGLRLPRVAAALVVGASLSAAGAALQALFRNPLADPGLIGTSSGAVLAVVSVLALGVDGVGLPAAAFAGGLAATWILLVAARLLGGGEVSMLLLGLVLGMFVAAATGLMLLLSDDLTLRAATVWLSGHLGTTAGASLAAATPVAAAGLALLVALGRDLDCLMLGEEEARSLGVQVERVRLLTAIGASLAVGAAVSVAGVIGFIGMMVPNACALVLGGSRRRLIAASAIVGGLFLLLFDTAARSIAYPVDLPVGLLAGLSGPVFFVWLLRRRARGVA